MSTSGKDWDELDPEDWDEDAFEEFERQEEERALSPAGIAEANAGMLRRWQDFRRAADAVVAAWRAHPEVSAVALIGSLAGAPWKEVPRFSPYRRARIEIWHECGDLNLALWLTDIGNLNGLRRAKDRALRELSEKAHSGVASHHVEAFILHPGTDGYLGALCNFNRCPRGKAACLVAGCGATKFLRQYEDFEWRPQSLAPDRTVRLFDRASGHLARAADLPLPRDDEEDEQDL